MEQALTLSRRFFEEHAREQLLREFPALAPRLAAGLCGNGSECFGYDDELSRDHDWGVDFFLWLPEDAAGETAALTAWKEALFASYPELPLRRRSQYGAHVGVETVGSFYRSLIGFPKGPQTIEEWRMVPQENLAMAVNGQVFCDGDGEFTAVREYLLGFYPEDLRLKKIAARCMAIAQTGQYNLRRCMLRGDTVTMRTVLARFTDEVIGLVFLLNKTFKPYYKWQYRRMTELPLLGATVGAHLRTMAETPGLLGADFDKLQALAEEICRLLLAELRRQELTDSDDWFFSTHGEEAQRRIRDPWLQRLPPQYE